MKFIAKIMTYLLVLIFYVTLFNLIIRDIIWKVIFIYDPRSYAIFEKLLFIIGLIFLISVTHQLFFQKTKTHTLQYILYTFVYILYIIGPMFMREQVFGSFNFKIQDIFFLNQTKFYLPIAIYNLSLFFPLGFIKKINFISYFGLVLSLEAIQYFTGLGAFDIVDILVYTIGFIAARLIYNAIKKESPIFLLLAVLLIFSFLFFIINI